VGECACVSVHGANRLGGNSLLDIVVFGRAAGNDIIEYLHENRFHRPLNAASVEQALARLSRWERRGEGETVDGLRRELQQIMEQHCGVFRSQTVLEQGLDKVVQVQQRLAHAVLRDHSRVFNTARIEALELENLVELALATVTSALGRTESRGAHSRVDHPQRDDERWLRHTLFFREGRTLDYKPVRMKPLTVESFAPKERTY
jgi:succinate dehydrogenase / fumarate reductase flavoprotein subunit